MKKSSHKLLGVVLSAAFLLALPAVVFAQSTSGITVSPPTTEENVTPGQLYTYTIRVENVGDATQVLYPKLRDITGIAKDGQPQFAKEGDESGYGLSSWVSFDKASLTIPKRGSGTLEVIVHVPTDATPGAHIGSVALTETSPTQTTTGSAVGYEVRSILSLRVAGEVIEKASIRQFFADHIFFTKPNVMFTTTIVNEGNVFSRPRGFIDITNMFGKKVDTLPVNEGGASTFPLSERDFVTNWTSNDFHIGKYRAELTLTVEGAQGFQSILATTQFWVVPTGVLLPVLGGLLLLVVLFRIILGIYIKKQIAMVTGGRGAALSSREKEAASLSRLSVVVIALLIALLIGVALLFLLG
jgi:hypothetical protein